MAQTPSNMIPLGTIAPDFKLFDTIAGTLVSLEDIAGNRPLVVMFICNHCPFVKHINPELVKLANDFIPKGVAFVAISSNDAVTYPEDGPDKMKEWGNLLSYPFPYLFDESQEVAKAYDAACTPDFYVFDAQRKLIYRGQLDDSRPSNGIPVNGKDLRYALNNLVLGHTPSEFQKPSIGCNIKWKK